MIALTDKQLIAAFSTLPRRRRQIFWLVNSHGYKYAEVSRELGVSRSHVRKELQRAYDFLADETAKASRVSETGAAHA